MAKKSGETRAKKLEKKTKKVIAFAVITIGVWGVLTLLNAVKAFDYLEYKAYDFRVNLFAASAKPSDEIFVFLIDQPSLDWASSERGWGFPWPRSAWAELVDYMNAAGAKSVAFDLLFTEPSVYGAADDEEFARASRDFGHVMQGVHFSTQSGSAETFPVGLNKPFFETAGFGNFLDNFDVAKKTKASEKTEAVLKAQLPIPVLLDSAGAIGSAVGTLDTDGVVRRLNLFTFFDGKAVPGESSASLLLAGESGNLISYDAKKKVIRWEERVIPVDAEGKSLLRFRGADFNRYIPYSMSVLLQSAEAFKKGEPPELPPEEFKDKYIFCGYYAPGLYDIVSTPLSSVYPGMGTHITMLDNILQGDFTQESAVWANLLLLFFCVMIVNAFTIFAGKIQVSLSAVIVFLAAVVGGCFLSYVHGWWFPMVLPLTGVALAYISATLYNYASEGRQKQFIKSAFSRYLSPIFIDQLIANPEQLKLGGERKEISIFFSDIQGFSTISEGLDPSTLTEMLNDYLTFMTNIIQDSGGTIDKYEGDAIIAFWNAPLDYPDHAARALGASMECQRRLAEQQAFYQEKYGAKLITRIGLNTGPAVVGNMGSSEHFNYTMLGDAVNLAARLEGLNKQFGTYLMCTETTFNAANAAKNGEFYGRKLASVAVVGKKEPAVVFEPLSKEIFEGKKPILEQFNKARDLFYAGKFGEALPLFEKIIDKDRPAYFYAEQCRAFIAHPAEWKGFWQATSK